MGNSESKNEEGDWQQLQRNPQYNNVMGQAYSQSSEANYRDGRRGYGPNHNPDASNIGSGQQTLAAVKVDFDLDPKSLALAPDQYHPNVFNLTFKITSAVPLEMLVMFAAHVQLDRHSGGIAALNPKITEDVKTFSFQSGKDMPLPGPCPLNFNKYTFKELARAFNDTIPILVMMDRKTKIPGFLEKVVYFLQVEQRTLTPTVISKSKPAELPSRHRHRWKVQQLD